jgi:hypothetical protein
MLVQHHVWQGTIVLKCLQVQNHIDSCITDVMTSDVMEGARAQPQTDCVLCALSQLSDTGQAIECLRALNRTW